MQALMQIKRITIICFLAGAFQGFTDHHPEEVILQEGTNILTRADYRRYISEPILLTPERYVFDKKVYSIRKKLESFYVKEILKSKDTVIVAGAINSIIHFIGDFTKYEEEMRALFHDPKIINDKAQLNARLRLLRYIGTDEEAHFLYHRLLHSERRVRLDTMNVLVDIGGPKTLAHVNEIIPQIDVLYQHDLDRLDSARFLDEVKILNLPEESIPGLIEEGKKRILGEKARFMGYVEKLRKKVKDTPVKIQSEETTESPAVPETDTVPLEIPSTSKSVEETSAEETPQDSQAPWTYILLGILVIGIAGFVLARKR